MTIKAFQKKIYDFYRQEKRSLPWRCTRDPYKILISEVMLQQTQAPRVMPKYHEFSKKFPTIQSLSSASLREVLRAWQGLGYNRRALLLKKTAEVITREHKGKFPKIYEELLALPGIGPYTASAIMVFAYNKPQVMIETNIRAVFLYFFFQKKSNVPDSKLISYIEKYADTSSPREWYNALMDYGAMLKRTQPNPSRKSKHHVTQSKFEGSIRQIRGAIVRAYAKDHRITGARLARELSFPKEIIIDQYKKLKKEGFFA